MRILLWHVHGSWTTAFVQGPHTYLIPVVAGRGPDGRGRARTWDWPPSAIEVPADQLREADIDVMILQRPTELTDLAERWSGRRPGRDVPAVYVEHNTPEGDINAMIHPLADRQDIPVAHVTHFNRVFWDTGRAPAVVVEHGIVDPGYRYTGELVRAAVVINDPVERARITGTDLVSALRATVPIDLFGMRSEPLGGVDAPQAELHARLAHRRVYLHPNRWTSLGLSLIEAMHLGMPVVGVGTTEIYEAVPPEAGIVSCRMDVLAAALTRLLADPDEAAAMGRAARDAALDHYNLKRFLDDWEALLEEVIR